MSESLRGKGASRSDIPCLQPIVEGGRIYPKHYNQIDPTPRKQIAGMPVYQTATLLHLILDGV